MNHALRIAAVLLASLMPAAYADDPVFSGPQVGEKLVPFKTLGVYDEQAGKEFDLIKQADGKPVCLIFVHKLTRPSAATLRTVMNYASLQAKKKPLVAGVVFLGEDATMLEEQLKRARHALPQGVLVGISADGGEGPGAYGLNRKMTLTVLVGKESKVTANFPLVQPSVAADVPKISAAVAKAIGVDPPTEEDLKQASELNAKKRPKKKGKPDRPKSKPQQQDPNLRGLLVPVISKDASKEEVDAAAKKLEEYLAQNPETAKQVGAIANRIIDAGVLEKYGTPRAQEHLRTWAKKYGAEKKDRAKKERVEPRKQ